MREDDGENEEDPSLKSSSGVIAKQIGPLLFDRL